MKSTQTNRGVKFYYFSILRSEQAPRRFYIGFTENLKTRLKDHHSVKNPHTTNHKPWKVKTAIAFSDRHELLDFERYLKSHSGRAFAKRRL